MNANTLTTIVNWAAALLIVAIYAAMQTLDIGPSDHATDINQAQDLQDAIKSEAAKARFAGAASQICGENAGWTLVDDGRAIQCTTKRGRRTQKVAL